MRFTGNDPGLSCLYDVTSDTRVHGIEISWSSFVSHDSFVVTKNGIEVEGSPFPGDTTSYLDPEPGNYNNEYSVQAIPIGNASCDPVVDSTKPQDMAVIGIGDDWRFFRGRVAPSDPATAWRTPEFDESAWEIGPTGIGFGDSDDATELTDMEGSYVSVFLRKTFTMPDLELVTNVVLSMDYDDGYIAYLDGTEIARSSTMGTVGREFGHAAVALGYREAGTESVTEISDLLSSLATGSHVLAIQVHNRSIDSSDLSALPELAINDCTANLTGVANTILNTVTLSFSALTVDALEITRNGQPVPGSPLDSGTTRFVDSDPGTGLVEYALTPIVGGHPCEPQTSSVTIDDPDPRIIFRRGDHDDSSVMDITDVVGMLNFLFLGLNPSVCMDASDIDNSGVVDISDAFNALTFMFLGTVQIPPPGSVECGEDPTTIIPDGQVPGLPAQPAVSLGCERYPSETCT